LVGREHEDGVQTRVAELRRIGDQHGFRQARAYRGAAFGARVARRDDAGAGVRAMRAEGDLAADAEADDSKPQLLHAGVVRDGLTPCCQ
jgi:hypothetical protein